VLATDLMLHVQRVTLGYNSGPYQVLKHSDSNKGIIKFDWNINDNNNKLAVIYNFS
jgi:hypothetical protein